MNIIGKYYLIDNKAATRSAYWCAANHCWSTDPYEATLYETHEDAEGAARDVQRLTDDEVRVVRATRELTPRKPEYDSPIDMMKRIGGSFASAIAQAWYCADSFNRMRLETAFATLFSEYGDKFNQWKAQADEQNTR